tara:strand:- start:1918 stop:2229 length:312 start_codon:yes stop_codon:yes gene_type:complete
MAEVVDISTQFRLLPKKKGYKCRCSRVHIVEKSRMIECRDCGAVQDPYDYLMNMAETQNRVMIELDHRRREVAKLGAEIQELKRIKVNLNAQVRRKQKVINWS